MWELIRGYLTFTRKERIGVLFLLLAIGLLFILPHFLKPSPGDRDPAAYEKLKGYIRHFDSIENKTGDRSVVHERYLPNKSGLQPVTAGEDHPATVQLFFFDPNRIREEDWEKLGLSPGLARTVIHYIEKGGRFREKEDLKKIYGLRPEDYERLLPYIRISPDGPGLYKRHEYTSGASLAKSVAIKISDSSHSRSSGKFFYKEKMPEPVDINEADSIAWAGFPGIGRKLAARIVNFRTKLGGFYEVNQVAETFGLPDSVFEKMKPCLRVKTNALHQIDLNTATADALQAHPYIRWRLARAITSYRQQHVAFKSVDELLQIEGLDPLLFEKLKPYLSIGH